MPRKPPTNPRRAGVRLCRSCRQRTFIEENRQICANCELTKKCRVCGRRRIVPDEIERKRKVCNECRAKQSRDWYYENQETINSRDRARHAEAMRDPIRAEQIRRKSRERARRYRQDPVKRAKALESTRKYKRNLKERNPEQYQKQLEDMRMRARLRSMRNGKEVRPMSVEQYEQRYGIEWIAVEPLQELIRNLNEDGFSNNRIDEIAELPEGKTRHVLEFKERVKLSTAEKIIIAFGYHLNDVYPSEEEGGLDGRRESVERTVSRSISTVTA